MATVSNGIYDSTSKSLWNDVSQNRLPMKYLASLFTAGNTAKVVDVMKKLMAVRLHRRGVTVGDLSSAEISSAMNEAQVDAETADADADLHHSPHLMSGLLFSRHREESIEMLENTADVKGNTGFGFKETPARGL
ncbi:MAG: hypothetical protein R2847_10180 [Bacteroidia bacterium]